MGRHFVPVFLMLLFVVPIDFLDGADNIKEEEEEQQSWLSGAGVGDLQAQIQLLASMVPLYMETVFNIKESRRIVEQMETLFEANSNSPRERMEMELPIEIAYQIGNIVKIPPNAQHYMNVPFVELNKLLAWVQSGLRHRLKEWEEQTRSRIAEGNAEVEEEPTGNDGASSISNGPDTAGHLLERKIWTMFNGIVEMLEARDLVQVGRTNEDEIGPLAFSPANKASGWDEHRKVALFYYLFYWQTAMDTTECSPMRKWMLARVMPPLEELLLPIIQKQDQVDRNEMAFFDLRLLLRSFPFANENVRQQLEFAFRIAPVRMKEFDRYCLSSANLFRNALESIKNVESPKYFDKLRGALAYELTVWSHGSTLPAEQFELATWRTAERSRKFQQNVREKATHFYKEYVYGLYEKYFNLKRVDMTKPDLGLAFVFQFIRQLAEGRPSPQYLIAEKYVKASFITKDINLASHLHKRLRQNRNPENDTSKLINAVLKLVSHVGNRQKSIQQMADAIKQGHKLLNIHVDCECQIHLLDVDAEESDKIVEKAKGDISETLAASSQQQVIQFYKNYYAAVVNAYQENTLASELVGQEQPNLDWLANGVMSELEKMLFGEE